MKKIELPYLAERLLGVTIIQNDLMHACSYDGQHTIRLTPEVSIETTEELAEDYESLASLGTVLGVMGGYPILDDGKTKISYKFEPSSDFQEVIVERKEEKELIRFRTDSGDWFYATLSEDGSYIVLAEPYSIAIYKIDKDEAYQGAAHNGDKRRVSA